MKKWFGIDELVGVVSVGVLIANFTLDPTLLLTLLSIVFLAASISKAVHSAENIAKRIGPSLGALILALAVTVIEVGLIVSMMANEAPEASAVSTIARDTVFAALMIVTNGIIGISLLLGGLRHKELGFQPQGTSALLAVLVVLAWLTMVLPNYTLTTLGPTYSTAQLFFASVASLLLYGVLVWGQTHSHKSYYEEVSPAEFQKLEHEAYVPSKTQTWVSFGSLLVSLVVVIGLAKALSPAIEAGVKYIGAPPSFVGIVIALLVLAPESLAAVVSARKKQLQNSLNLAIGSGAASIALTIPVVSAYATWSDKSLGLGLDKKSESFLLLTFILGGMTLSTGRTTALQGVLHLVVLAAYIVMSLIP